jgi:hypothetical protein
VARRPGPQVVPDSTDVTPGRPEGFPLARTLAVHACLLACFVVVAASAGLPKSPTHDEPLHAVSGFLRWHHADYRIDPEDPALFTLWAALPQSATALRIDTTSDAYRAIPVDVQRDWDVVHESLYPGRPDDGVTAQRFIDRSRLMFLAVALLLGVLLGWWTTAIGGAAAGIIATTAYALDPTFLAHAPLVKNDVTMSLALLACAASMWGLGRGGGAGRIVLTGIAAGVALTVKFSGVVVVPVIVTLLVVRVALPGEWRVARWTLTSARSRSLGAAGAVVTIGVISGAIVWATYGFRYAALADGVPFNRGQMVDIARAAVLRAAQPDASVDSAAVVAAPVPAPVRIALWGLDHRVLPEGWLFGFLYTYATTRVRPAFLLGETSMTGWWYYFPLALLFKTPIATLIAAAAALALGVRVLIRRRERRWTREHVWSACCVIVPAAAYAASAMASNVNIGLRHFLPVVPLLWLGIGIGGGYAIQHRPRVTRAALGALGIALASETLAAYPHYLPFFNIGARSLPGSREGLALLGDSNLDWGQDLPLLAEWRRRHADRPLHLAYFGTADPRAHGVDYLNLPSGYQWGPPPSPLTAPAYVAISATLLQGVHNGDLFSIFREERSVAGAGTPRLATILGRSIYVYEWNR